ncbi:hypothetical protein PMAYCL1PPCAC_27548, partial [Pristionchus mayeri]
IYRNVASIVPCRLEYLVCYRASKWQSPRCFAVTSHGSPNEVPNCSKIVANQWIRMSCSLDFPYNDIYKEYIYFQKNMFKNL